MPGRATETGRPCSWRPGVRDHPSRS